jgi:hypothetical protein
MMVDTKTNGHYQTSDLEEAATLHASGLEYFGVEWPVGLPQASFVFAKRPDSVREAWQTHTIVVNAQALFSSWNVLRDDLETAKRRRVR